MIHSAFRGGGYYGVLGFYPEGYPRCEGVASFGL